MQAGGSGCGVGERLEGAVRCEEDREGLRSRGRGWGGGEHGDDPRLVVDRVEKLNAAGTEGYEIGRWWLVTLLEEGAGRRGAVRGRLVTRVNGCGRDHRIMYNGKGCEGFEKGMESGSMGKGVAGLFRKRWHWAEERFESAQLGRGRRAVVKQDSNRWWVEVEEGEDRRARIGRDREVESVVDYVRGEQAAMALARLDNIP